MKKIALLSGILVLALTTASLQFCVKPPDYPKAPVIEFLSMSKNILRQPVLGTDTLVIAISFTDGDGDLGSEMTLLDTSIVITDGRDPNLVQTRGIPLIEQQGAGNGISGEIIFELTNLPCCIYINPVSGQKQSCENVEVPTDSLFYKIRIKDRAGNISNEITTPWITLRCK